MSGWLSNRVEFSYPSSAEELQEGLSDSLKAAGYEVVEVRPAALVRAETRRPAWALLGKPGPHRIQWEIRARDGGCTGVLTMRFFAWYRTLIIVGCAVLGPLLAALCLDMMEWRQRAPGAGLALVALVIGGILGLFRLLTGGSYDEIVHAARVRLEHGGRLLEAMTRDGNPRHVTALTAYAAYWVGWMVVVLATDADWRVGNSPMRGIVVPLIMMMVVLFALLWAMWRLPGFSARIVPMVPALAGLIAVMMWLGMPLALVAGGRIAPAAIAEQQISAGRALVANTGGVGAPTRAQREQIVTRLAAMRANAALLLGLLALICGTAIGCLFAAGSILPKCRRYALELHRREGSAQRERAVNGREFRGWFQLLFAVLLVSLVWAFLPAIRVTALAAKGAVTGDWSAVEPILHWTRLLVAVVADWPLDDTRAIMVARVLWGAYGCLGGLVWLASLGELVGHRWQLARLIRRAPPLTIAVFSSEARAAIGACRIVEAEDGAPYAFAHAMEWPSRVESVVVSSRLRRMLRDRELAAVIAHEVAHLRAGDCRTELLLRLLGRCLLVGDTFVHAAFFDSYGLEERADRRAVQEFGADPLALWGALVKERHVAAAHGLQARLLPLMQFTAVVDEDETRGRGLRSWGLFVRQYTRADASHWYPSFDRRKAALRAMAAVEDDSQLALRISFPDGDRSMPS